MRIIKQLVDLYSNQIIQGIKTFLGKINIQTSDSSRTYYLKTGIFKPGSSNSPSLLEPTMFLNIALFVLLKDFS